MRRGSDPRSRRGAGAERAEGRAGIEELEDLARGVALLGHALGAPLAHAGAVAVAAPAEMRPVAVHRHREQRRLEPIVAEHPAEVVAAKPRAAAGAVHGDERRAQRGRALADLDGADAAD